MMRCCLFERAKKEVSDEKVEFRTTVGGYHKTFCIRWINLCHWNVLEDYLLRYVCLV